MVPPQHLCRLGMAPRSASRSASPSRRIPASARESGGVGDTGPCPRVRRRPGSAPRGWSRTISTDQGTTESCSSSPRRHKGKRPASAGAVVQTLHARPSSTPASANGTLRRPSSATYLGGTAKSRRSTSPNRWVVASAVPRTFDDLAAKEPRQRLTQMLGAKEETFRKEGQRQVEEERQQHLKEKALAQGALRRKAADAVRRSRCHAVSGEPWRSAKYSASHSMPGHLMGGSGIGSGLFSNVAPLEATEFEKRKGEVECCRPSHPPPPHRRKPRSVSSGARA